jgi:hypothetical protein
VAEGKLLLLLGWHLALTGLPAIACALFAARRGVRSVPILLCVALAAGGAVGILGFWTYYGEPLLGETFSYFVVLGSLLLAGWSLYGGKLDRGLLGDLATPLVLWGLGSLFLVMLGFLHGGADQPLSAAGSRFSGPLPGDNDIPRYFAEWFYENGHRGVPPVFPGEWHFSDRPPLQTGYVLSQRALGWDSYGLNYQLLGVVLQQLWIVGLWALLTAAGLRRTTKALATVAVLLSSLAILNGFFVWPKLLPAAFLLGAAALVMTPLWEEVRRSVWGAVLVAALCGFAMLGHGSSVFGIVPLALVAAYRGLPSVRWLGVGIAVGIALLAPWSGYQKWEDPPGNRLMKWTLAGVVEIDGRGTLEAIGDAYGEAGLGGTIGNKVENLKTIGGVPAAFEALEAGIESGDLQQTVEAVRGVNFFYLLPSMGLFLLAPFAMAFAAARRTRGDPAEWAFALTCFLVFAAGSLLWALIVFGSIDLRAVIHVGSYLLPILGMAGAVAGMRAAFPRFSLFYVGFASLLSLAIYVPAFLPPPGTSYRPLAAILCAAALAAFGIVAIRGGERRTQEK